MKIFLSIVLFGLVQHTSAQKIIISGKEENRSLLWPDFAGKPDASSSYSAMTAWDLRYNLSDIKISGDKADIGIFEVVLVLNPKTSWVKKGKETEPLLLHEQGHFDLGLLCMKEILEKEKAQVFTKNNFSDKLQSLFNETLKKYQDLGARYDKETEHSNNALSQEQWNNFFKQGLRK